MKLFHRIELAWRYLNPPLISTGTDDLFRQFNTCLSRKYVNPPVVTPDGKVRHGNWTYIAGETETVTDLFRIALAWGKHATPRKVL